LIDHWRESTGEGLDLYAPFSYEILGHDGIAPQSEKSFTQTNGHLGPWKMFGERYLLRNFLYDAGLAEVVAINNVCNAQGTQHSPCASMPHVMEYILVRRMIERVLISLRVLHQVTLPHVRLLN
jgi:hypothetical protein